MDGPRVLIFLAFTGRHLEFSNTSDPYSALSGEKTKVS